MKTGSNVSWNRSAFPAAALFLGSGADEKDKPSVTHGIPFHQLAQDLWERVDRDEHDLDFTPLGFPQGGQIEGAGKLLSPFKGDG